MDLNEIRDYFPQQAELNSLDQRMEEPTPLPTLCPNDLEAIINSLFPSEDNNINKTENTTGFTVDNNDHVMDSKCGLFEQIKETSEKCEDEILILTTSFNNNNRNSSSISSDNLNTSRPIESTIPSYSTQNIHQSSTERYNGFNGVNPALQHQWHYIDQQSNFLTLLSQGFKPTVSLCTDTSLVKEPWKPNVTKKILSVFYSPLNIKSEFLSTQTALDEFQSLALKEAVAAFHDVALVNNMIFRIGKNKPDSCPKVLVSTCTKMRAYRRLSVDDKVTLLSNVFFDVVAMKSVLTYDKLTDSWNCSGIRVDRRNVFRLDASLHNGIVHVIETFPDRWRRDLTVAALIYLIIIFNPDLPSLKFAESIRLEHYTYIYLLKRYFEATCEFPDDASDYHYRLMAKIEEIQNLRQHMQNVFEMFILNYSLSSCMNTLIRCNDLP